MNNINLVTIFMTGLLTGGLTCMAVQGGLLAATIAQREEERLKQKMTTSGNALPILAFLATKLIAYTLFGFLLGWFGSLFQLSAQAQLVLQFGVAIFMLGTALNILNVHPIFRYFIIQPPRFITRLIRKKSKSGDMYAPAMLGGFTVFIPCGTTQAMMALAIASSSPLLGAAVMLAFTLGTSPVFFTLGYLATRLSGSLHARFMQVAAYAIIVLAVFNLNNAIALTGSSMTLQNIGKGFWCTFSFCDTGGNGGQAANITNAVNIAISDYGYTPREFSVKAGSSVAITLKNGSAGGCAQAFTIPSLGVQKIVSLGTSSTVTFTAPTEAKDIAFMCSMGMYQGVIHVVKA